MSQLMMSGWRAIWQRSIGAIPGILAQGIARIGNRRHYATDQLRTPIKRAEERRNVQMVNQHNRDRLRQVLNLVFAIGQIVATYLTVVTGAEAQFTARSTTEPPIIPAPYTFFVIWSVIYASTIAYAIYQALPQQRENELLRRIGFWTAAAFAGTSAWLFAASQYWPWVTVAVFFAILGALLVPFAELIRRGAPRSNAERYLVVMPISIYTAWATIGTIANTASALNASGLAGIGVAPATWAIIMLLIAGMIASFVATVSRGNIWYALTIGWALAGIVVANSGKFPLVSIVAASVALLVLAVLLRARRLAGAAA